MTARDIAEKNTILESQLGSHAFGLALEGNADIDLMGVCMEPPEYVIGLKTFEQDVFRSQPQGVRSQAGDTDRTTYSARKFCRLALGGNPSIISLFYAIPTIEHPLGRELLMLAPAFAARSAGKAFLGYSTQQRQRMLGERGQMNVKRPELVDAHGFDTKYASHMLRLGFQGVEYLSLGRLTLPMPREEREFILSVRRGEVSMNDVLGQATELEREIEDLLDTSPLPAKPDHDTVNQWLVSAYTRWWKEGSDDRS